MTGTHRTPAQGVVAGAGVRAVSRAIRAAGMTVGMSKTGLSRGRSQGDAIGVASEKREDCPGLITRGEESMTQAATPSQEAGMGLRQVPAAMIGRPGSLKGNCQAPTSFSVATCCICNSPEASRSVHSRPMKSLTLRCTDLQLWDGVIRSRWVLVQDCKGYNSDMSAS